MAHVEFWYILELTNDCQVICCQQLWNNTQIAIAKNSLELNIVSQC